MQENQMRRLMALVTLGQGTVYSVDGNSIKLLCSSRCDALECINGDSMLNEPSDIRD